MTGRTADGRIETVRIVPEGSPVANYAFDVTPARLVTGLITERGVLQGRPRRACRRFSRTDRGQRPNSEGRKLMQSAWTDRDADAAVARYAGLGRDLALRVYTTRLLGRDPRLVLHGGGNTSVKTRSPTSTAMPSRCCASRAPAGTWATIEPAGLPAVRLAPLLKLRAPRSAVRRGHGAAQRANLIDPAAPNPSVETLLHAFMPHKFVDHTHSTAVLALADQPDGEALCREVCGERVGYVPYIMPGFALAKAAARGVRADPSVEGLMLVKHGIFSFGDDARESLRADDRAGDAAEERLAKNRKPAFAGASCRPRSRRVADVAPICAAPAACPTAKSTAPGSAWCSTSAATTR